MSNLRVDELESLATGRTVSVDNIDTGVREDLANPDSDVLLGGVGVGDLARKYGEAVSVKDFGAKGDWDDNSHTGTDDTAAIQAAIDSGNVIHFPRGQYKVSSTITLPHGTLIFGDGWGKTKIFAYGCDALRLLTGTNIVTIERMELSSYSSTNSIDPKTWSGISSEGANGQQNSWLTARDLRMRGWGICIDLRYTWNSVIDNVDTSFCTQGVRLFGQSVNNSINNSRLGANTGDYCVNLQSDGAVIGEGLMISNSLLASGAYGVYGNNGFLSLNISNCVIDLITNTAIHITDPRSLLVSNSWLSAANRGINLPALGSLVNLGTSITGNRIMVTNANGVPVYVGGGNNGITISGGSLESVNAHAVYSLADNIAVTGANIVSTNANGIYFEDGINCVAVGITGNINVLYGDRSKTSKQTIAASSVVFPVNQVASPDPNTLDDYEEGSWTPNISTDGSGSPAFVTTHAVGRYVKIGRLVTVTCSYKYSSTGSVGNSYAYMTGLPFPPAGDGVGSVCSVAIEQSSFDTKNYYGCILVGTSNIGFRYDNANGGVYGGAPYMTGNTFPAGGTVRFVMSYLSAN